MYTIAGRQVGSHWVCQFSLVAGEALHHCLPGPIGRAQLVQGFENDVLTILGPIACDVDSWNARGSQCQFYGRISREEDPRTTYQCPKSR